MLNFRNLEFMSRDLYRMLFCSSCKISLKLDKRPLSYGQKNSLQYGGRTSAIMNVKNFHFGHVSVTEFQICCCVPNSMMSYRRDMAI